MLWTTLWHFASQGFHWCSKQQMLGLKKMALNPFWCGDDGSWKPPVAKIHVLTGYEFQAPLISIGTTAPFLLTGHPWRTLLGCYVRLRTCLEMKAFITGSSSGGFLHRHRALRVIIKPMSHRILSVAKFLPQWPTQNQHLESMKQDFGWWTLLEISSLWAFYLHVVIVMIATHCNYCFFLNNVRFIAPWSVWTRQDVQTELKTLVPGLGHLVELWWGRDVTTGPYYESRKSQTLPWKLTNQIFFWHILSWKRKQWQGLWQRYLVLRSLAGFIHWVYIIFDNFGRDFKSEHGLCTWWVSALGLRTDGCCWWWMMILDGRRLMQVAGSSKSNAGR